MSTALHAGTGGILYPGSVLLGGLRANLNRFRRTDDGLHQEQSFLSAHMLHTRRGHGTEEADSTFPKEDSSVQRCS